METIIGFFLFVVLILVFVFAKHSRGKLFVPRKENLDIKNRVAPDQELVVLVVRRYIKYHQSHGSTDDDDTLAHQFFEEAYLDKKSTKEPDEKLTETEREELEECYDNINRENLLYEVPDWLKTYSLQWSGRQDEGLL